VGFAAPHFELTRKPGWDPDSYGYHADDGHKYSGSERGEPYGPPCGVGDVIGCGIRFDDCSIFFTRNGTFLGKAFNYPPAMQLYATIGLHSPNESLSVNFGGPSGAPFVFDLDAHVAREKARVYASLGSFDVPVDDLMSLVRSYCLHFGYAQTFAALPGDVRGGGPTAAESQPAAPSPSVGMALSDSAKEADGDADSKPVTNGEGAASAGANGAAGAASRIDTMSANGFVANGSDDARNAHAERAQVACAGVGTAAYRHESALASLQSRHAVRESIMRGDIDGCMALLRERFPSVLDAEHSPARATCGPMRDSHGVPARLSPAASRGPAAMDVAEPQPTSPAITPGGPVPPGDEEASTPDARSLLLRRRSTMDSELDEVPAARGASRGALRPAPTEQGASAVTQPNGIAAGSDEAEPTTATSPLSREYLMQHKWRALFHLKCQGFIELVRRRKLLEAVEYGQAQLAPLRDSLSGADVRDHLEDVVALLAYAGLEDDEAGDDKVPHEHHGLCTMTGASANGSYSRAHAAHNRSTRDERRTAAEAHYHAPDVPAGVAHAASIFCSRAGVGAEALPGGAARRECVRRLMSYEQRERTADLLNAAILGADSRAFPRRTAPRARASRTELSMCYAPSCTCPARRAAEIGADSTSVMEGLLRQLFVTHEVTREANGGRGEFLAVTA